MISFENKGSIRGQIGDGPRAPKCLLLGIRD
jgi:hypothetical protein